MVLILISTFIFKVNKFDNAVVARKMKRKKSCEVFKFVTLLSKFGKGTI